MEPKQYYIGIDVGGTSVKEGLFDEDGNLLAKASVPTPPIVDAAGFAAVTEAIVAGAGSRVFADCLRKTIMSRAAETVSADPAGPAGTMDRSFLLHHIASSFVATVQWWAWHNFQAPKEDVAKDYLSAIKPLFG